MTLQDLVITLIRDLSPTGLLIVGLYFFIGKYLRELTEAVKRINEEIATIIYLLDELRKSEHGKI